MPDPTIVQIADELGVSKSTVSRALRGVKGISAATVTAVQEVADRLGYVPSVAASSLSTGMNHAIGVVTPSVTRWFYTTVLSGIDVALADAGFDVVLFDLSRGIQNVSRLFDRSLLRRRVDGLIVLSTAFAPQEQSHLASVGVPIIAVGARTPGVRRIGVNDVAIATVATQHLIDLGHRKLALIGGVDPEGLNSIGPRQREQGFRQTLETADIPIHEDWMCQGGYSLSQAKYSTSRLLAIGRHAPTGIVCTSDEMAIGALQAIREAGYQPGADISVVGIDGHPFAAAFGLTTVAQDPARQGREAAQQIVAEVAGAEPSKRFRLADFELIVRESSQRPGLREHGS